MMFFLSLSSDIPKFQLLLHDATVVTYNLIASTAPTPLSFFFIPGFLGYSLYSFEYALTSHFILSIGYP